MKLYVNFLAVLLVFVTGSAIAQDEEYKTFKDKKVGYTVNYPKKWKAKGGDTSFYCGREAGFSNSEFVIIWSDADDQERIDFYFTNADFYKDYIVQRETVTIDGLQAEHIIATKRNNPEVYSEEIILKTPEKWYKFQNAGVYDLRFRHFYESFHFLTAK
ncbi:hypothetical protein NBRC110019_16190 [Neptunitalea chrysea]|uniref:Uncharacterized protein n=1 Tax=Neptunitalea chrysea TaxID=1647581 RepID=A0A9W6EUG6_9FLAO|nr:hypothetical protein [Neptunitalea chrysea]GLB52579.1 hypothetical protein NBRC110019_16190 [Neptunitalea chrysea]